VNKEEELIIRRGIRKFFDLDLDQLKKDFNDFILADKSSDYEIFTSHKANGENV
jgi:hypothetical protein